MFQLLVAIIIALFVAYNFFHYALFLLVTHPCEPHARKACGSFVLMVAGELPGEPGAGLGRHSWARLQRCRRQGAEGPEPSATPR